MTAPGYHARTHKPGGSDPIRDFIAFDWDNQGGYLFITANDTNPVNANGFEFVNNAGDFWIWPSGTDRDQGGEFVVWGDSGALLGLFAGGAVEVNAATDKTLELSGQTVEAQLRASGDIFRVRGLFHGPAGPGAFYMPLLEISADGDVTFRLEAGKSITVNDSTGTAMLQMTEGSPDLHIPTGGTVVADL